MTHKAVADCFDDGYEVVDVAAAITSGHVVEGKGESAPRQRG